MVMKALSTTAGALRVWPEPGHWTYEAYACLPEDGFGYEVIEGELFMSPAPATIHQRISRRLLVLFDSFAAHTGSGEVLAAPCDVVLDRMTVVQPDLLFVTADRRSIIGPQNLTAAPDLVVEITSPGDPAHDRERKYELYARHGVREYWIVDPAARTVDLFTLDGPNYVLALHAGPGDMAESVLLAGFAVSVDEVLAAED